MNTIIKRLLIFFLGVPAVFAIVYFVPFCRHLLFNALVVLSSAGGAVEFSSMLEKKQIYVKKTEAFILGALAPLSLALIINFNFPQWILPLMIMSGASLALLSCAFTSSKNMDIVVKRLAGIFCVLVYPGFFMYWLIRLTAMENASFLILLFLFITFGTDSAAWLFGTLFGKNNRGIIPASPNKSIAGYIGGALGSMFVTVIAILIIPHIFTSRFSLIPIIPAAIILGLFTGIATALGDMAESAIKRSCDVKDSGKLMLGRGGVLDSIDSVAFGAPVFFLLLNVLFINS
jgi:phosphatidate cytidylyltransferase